MAQAAEAALNIAFEHPDRRVAFGQRTKALTNGVSAGPAFPKPVGVTVPDRLRNGFESQRVERLHGAVPQGGNAQGPQLAVLFRNVVSAQGKRPITTTFQVLHCCILLSVSPP